MKINNNSMKKIAATALICILAAVSFTNVFAQVPGQNNNGFGQMMPPMGSPHGQQMGQDINGQNNNGFGQMPPMGGPQNDTANLQNVIDEVTDSDTKAALQTLLDAFESAITAEKNADSDEIESLRQATSEAFEALMTALKNAGIEPQAQQQPPFNGNGQMPPAPMGQQN